MIAHRRGTGLFRTGIITMALLLHTGASLASVQSSANYGMKANIVTAGGGASGSSSYTLKSAAGQSGAIGKSASASYRLNAGFFLPLLASPAATAPSVTTDPATYVSSSGGTLNGTVNDNGATTTVTFDYGLTSAYGTTIAATTGGSISAGTGGTPTSVAISGLSCNSIYHFRVNAQNTAGSVSGSDMTFSTSACGTTNQTIGTISVTPSTLTVGGTGTVSATATSGLAVSFTSTTPTVCSVSGTTVSGLTAGTCTIAADQSGNGNFQAAAQQTQSFPISGPLALTVSTVPDGAVIPGATLNVCGIVTDPSFLASLTINGTPIHVTATGGFSYPLQLVAGANTVTVIATSTMGDAITDNRTVYLDATAPEITILFPADNLTLVHSFATVSGRVSQGSTVTCSVNGGTPQGSTMNGADFTCTVSIIKGINTIVVTATNPAGISAQAKRTLFSAPAFSLGIISPASDIRTANSSWLLTGLVAENASPVSITVTMDGQTFTPAVSNNTFQQQLTFTEGKVYPITITGTDESGASIIVQRNITYTAPASAPSFTIEDALITLYIAAGLEEPQAELTQRLDVAPMVNGVSKGDGVINLEDVVAIMQLVVGAH